MCVAFVDSEAIVQQNVRQAREAKVMTAWDRVRKARAKEK